MAAKDLEHRDHNRLKWKSMPSGKSSKARAKASSKASKERAKERIKPLKDQKDQKGPKERTKETSKGQKAKANQRARTSTATTIKPIKPLEKDIKEDIKVDQKEKANRVNIAARPVIDQINAGAILQLNQGLQQS